MAMRTQRMPVSALAVLTAFTLAACGTESGSGAGSGDSGDGSGTVRTEPAVTGVHWNVSSLTAGGTRTAAPEGTHIEIDSEGKAFQGELTAAVAGKGHARTLTLTTARGDSIALTAEPPAPLTGNAWKVTGLVSGSAASSVPAGTEDKAHLTFGEDGSVEGNLGCNSFHGKATVSGSTITFGPLASTRKMCPGPGMRLERALLGVLQGKTSYEIDHRSLSIEAKSGEGLD